MSDTKQDASERASSRSERLDEADLRTMVRIWPFARPDAWAIALAMLITPVVAVLNLAQPLLLKEAIDAHIVPGASDGLRGVALLYLATVAGSYVAEALYSTALAWSGHRTILRLREALYSHTLKLSQRFFDRQPAGTRGGVDQDQRVTGTLGPADPDRDTG